MDQINIEKFIFPGQIINIKDQKYNTNNFYQCQSHLKSLFFGYLIEESRNNIKYIDVIKKTTTYIPEINQFVIGVIKNKFGDFYNVDINAPLDGSLEGLAFDGATKRNKPNLNAGDLIYTRISEYSKFLGAKVSCLNAGFSAKNVLGELKGGMIVYGLRGKQKQVEKHVQVLSKLCQFQLAMGRNDILWFSCKNSTQQMILYNIFNEIMKGCSQQLFQNLIKLLNK